MSSRGSALGGMTFGTLLTLFVLPTVYTLLTRPRHLVAAPDGAQPAGAGARGAGEAPSGEPAR